MASPPSRIHRSQAQTGLPGSPNPLSDITQSQRPPGNNPRADLLAKHPVLTANWPVTAVQLRLVFIPHSRGQRNQEFCIQKLLVSFPSKPGLFAQSEIFTQNVSGNFRALSLNVLNCTTSRRLTEPIFSFESYTLPHELIS